MRYSFRTLIFVFLFLSILVGGIASEIHSQLLEKQRVELELKLGHMQLEVIKKILNDQKKQCIQGLTLGEELSEHPREVSNSTSHLYTLSMEWIVGKQTPPPAKMEPKNPGGWQFVSRPLHIEIYNTLNCLSEPVTLRLIGDSPWNDKFAACVEAEFKAQNWNIEIIKTRK